MMKLTVQNVPRDAVQEDCDGDGEGELDGISYPFVVQHANTCVEEKRILNNAHGQTSRATINATPPAARARWIGGAPANRFLKRVIKSVTMRELRNFSTGRFWHNGLPSDNHYLT